MKKKTLLESQPVSGFSRSFMGCCRRHALKLLFTAALILGTTQPLQAIYIIDSFDTLQATNTPFGDTNPYFVFTNAAAAEVIGGQRDISLERLGGTGRLSAKVFDRGGGDTIFSFSNPGSPNYGRAWLIWDGVDSLLSAATNYTGLGGVDLTQSGHNDRFLLNIGSDNGAAMEIRVYTDEFNYSLYQFTVPSGTISAFTNMVFGFANFTNVGSGANFANVGAITMQMTNFVGGLDLGMALFVAIPEPSSAILWLLGAGTLGVCRRRRRS